MAALIGLFVGALVGNLLWNEWGAALGAVAGFLVGVRLSSRRSAPAMRLPGDAPPPSPSPPAGLGRPEGTGSGVETALRERVAALERRVASLEGALAEAGLRAAPESPTAAETGARAAPGGSAESTPPPIEVPAPVAGTPLAAIVPPAATASAPPASAPAVARGDAAKPGHALWRWFTGVNALSRIGVVVLFFGVAFLLRYFAEQWALPIAVRLVAVAAAGLALAGLGLRLAATRPAYGRTLQGAGAGVLYLTTYAAFRLYGVLPEAAAIALLVAVSVATVWLAVRSDAQALAGLAIAGGFAAPMLIATGGEPLWLFGYVAVLNGAIFALAWTKAWRALDALGFVCTFVLGGLWGHGFYEPEHYALVQPFLVLFFVFYVTIVILHARRGPPAVRHPVDALLVFGVPLAAFGLQAALVRDVAHGAAWSALALAGVYALLHLALRRHDAPGAPLLSRAFLALAAIFVLIAIPFALDNRETAALWAVAAGGAHWIGVRQDSRLVRLLALFVQLAAGPLFVVSGIGGADDPLFANAFFVGALLIALAGLATARIADGAGEALPAAERGLTPLVFGWGVLWWLAAGGVELVRQLSSAAQAHAVLAWVTASVALALAVSRFLRWPRLATAGIALLPAMAVAALGDFDRARTTLAAYGWAIWPCAWLVHWCALRAADAAPRGLATTAVARLGGGAILQRVHAASALALTLQLAWEASEWTGRFTPSYTAWTPCAAALPAIVYLGLAARWSGSARWPSVPYGHAYATTAGVPLAALLGLWFVVVNLLSPGDASPLPYVPLASPLDLTLLLALFALAAWARRCTRLSGRERYRWIGIGLFVALNGIVVRTAHHWADIPWRLASMLASKPLQAALTLAWTATALPLMVVATRRGLRPLWMLGAGLLALVVGKLFLVDLGALSGLPRVVAFLGVGILLLVIGYLSPLPPATTDDGSEGGAPPAT